MHEIQFPVDFCQKNAALSFNQWVDGTIGWALRLFGGRYELTQNEKVLQIEDAHTSLCLVPIKTELLSFPLAFPESETFTHLDQVRDFLAKRLEELGLTVECDELDPDIVRIRDTESNKFKGISLDPFED